MNQLEFGDEDISFERFDLAALIRGVLQSMEILAQQDELKIISVRKARYMYGR